MPEDQKPMPRMSWEKIAAILLTAVAFVTIMVFGFFWFVTAIYFIGEYHGAQDVLKEIFPLSSVSLLLCIATVTCSLRFLLKGNRLLLGVAPLLLILSLFLMYLALVKSKDAGYL